MSYIIEQKVKGRIYLYEVESYWDKEKKTSSPAASVYWSKSQEK